MKFTKEKLERAFTELLGNENFPHHPGSTINRAAAEVLIEADLLEYLLARYANQNLTQTEAKSIILQLKTLPSTKKSSKSSIKNIRYLLLKHLTNT